MKSTTTQPERSCREKVKPANWKNHLEYFEALREELIQKRSDEANQLRFNRSMLIASDIAGQFYCEKKVEMQYLHGEVETEAKTIGSKAHAALEEDAVRIGREDLWKKIYGKKPVFAVEMFILAKYNDITLGGIPDSILFQSGFPLMVFEFKFTKNQIAYLSHHVQAMTYGTILEKMGFDTSRLFYAIVTADPSTRGNKEFRTEAITATVRNGPKEAIIPIKDATVHIHKFNMTNAGTNICWAIDYWKQKREVELTNNPRKCVLCEYQDKCRINK